MKVNLGKSKLMVCGSTERRERLDLRLKGEMLEEVDSFKYLGSIVSKNGGVVEDVISRVNVSLGVQAATVRGKRENPGLPIYTCRICKQTIDKCQTSICCNFKSKHWTHLKCSGIRL